MVQQSGRAHDEGRTIVMFLGVGCRYRTPRQPIFSEFDKAGSKAKIFLAWKF